MSRRDTIHEMAEVISICCNKQSIADLMDDMLAADDHEKLTDYQAHIAGALFDSLAELRPDCVSLAQERDYIQQPNFLLRLLGAKPG